ncbi:beta-defensin 35 precursor [Mus musculus]|uniref:Beta-defensin 35 n=1 Tax=Mus musculus TaxID=10090 RepID=DFB35_MOUSE|eukprot:NP_631970.1 beta-defensin 35 precursor [Mus musculus]
MPQTFFVFCFLFFVFLQLFPGTGEIAVCETCRLGRGKCRRACIESEKIVGWCKLNFFCCRERI